MDIQQLDPLKEIVSIGAGNGATAISKLLNEKVSFETPELELLPIEAVSKRFGEKEQKVTVVLNKLTGEFSGVVLFIFTPQSADQIGAILTHDPELSRSALNEMVNIFLGNALKAVEDFLNLRILHSIPSQQTDMLGSLIDPVISKLGEQSEKVLAVNIKFKVKDLEFKILFLTDPNSTKHLLTRLNDKVGINGA